MNTRISMKLPIIVTIILIIIIVGLFVNIKQETVTCEKETNYSDAIKVKEKVITTVENNKISEIIVKKTIILDEKYYSDDEFMKNLRNDLERTLDYLGDKVEYKLSDNGIIININVKKNELVLLDNISFKEQGGKYMVEINSNTKSGEVISLKIGDIYTEGELMKRIKQKGYSCK